MPSHITVLNGRDRDDIEQCKRRMAAMIDGRHGYLLDFRIP